MLGPIGRWTNLHIQSRRSRHNLRVMSSGVAAAPSVGLMCVKNSKWKCFFLVFFIISALEFFVDILESICAIGVCYPFSFFPPLKSKEYRGERERRFCFHIKNPKAAHSMNFHQSGTSSPVFNDDRWNDLSSYFFSKERKNKSCESESNWKDNHTEVRLYTKEELSGRFFRLVYV